MKELILIVMLAVTTGCTTDYQRGDANNKRISQALKEGKNPFPTSTLTAYSILHGVQLDESNFINGDDLNHVAHMAVCPKVSINENPYSYRAEAKIDRNDMTVKVNINRGNCAIDTVSVKSYLDNAIRQNQQKQVKQFEREQRAKEVDARGPYKMGCEAYQQHIKGWSDVASIEKIVKLYPKINATYVRNLFVTGWNDAKVYGARGVDCEYLSLSVRR